MVIILGYSVNVTEHLQMITIQTLNGLNRLSNQCRNVLRVFAQLARKIIG